MPELTREILFREELANALVYIVPRVSETKNTRFVDECDRGKIAQTEILPEFIVPHFTVEILRPWNFFFAHVILQFCLLAVVVNTDDFQSLRVELLIKFFKVRHFCETRSAPSCPEIDHHDFATQFFQIELAAIHSLELEIEWFSNPCS